MDRIFGVGLVNFLLLWVALSLMTVLMKGVLNQYKVEGLTEVVNTI